MAKITLTLKLNCLVRCDEADDIWVSVCPRLKVYSQGENEEEAVAAMRSAILLHVTTAFDQNRLDKVLHAAGFYKMEEATPPYRSEGSQGLS